MAREEINSEYFSGSQASIFIGDIWVDDILDWQCSVGANAMPIYGYGSTFYDKAIQGRVLVQGSFTINFREPNYLFAILARYQSFKPKLNVKKYGVTSPLLVDNELKELNYQDKRRSIDDFFYDLNTEETIVVSNTIRNGTSIMDTLESTSNNFGIPTFDIRIGYGSTLDENTVAEKILGVKLLGKGKVIMANGEPIRESYNFFARNLV